MSSHAELYETAIDTLRLVTEIVEEDVDLFTLVLKRHLVPGTVDTPLYPRLIDFILTSQATGSADEDGATSVPYYLQIETIVNQLLEAGHQAEAGTLLMQHRATHRALRTFDAAFSIISRLFSGGGGGASSRHVHKI